MSSFQKPDFDCSSLNSLATVNVISVDSPDDEFEFMDFDDFIFEFNDEYFQFCC